MHTLPTWIWFVVAAATIVGVVWVIVREIADDIWRKP